MYEIDKRTLRWSEFKHMQAEEMLQHVQSKVFPFLKDMNGAESNFTHHMKNAVFIIPKPALLVEAVKTIDEIFEVMEKDSQEKGQAFQDIQGDVYEMLLSEIATAGKNGQFRTPRHIIKLMAELVQPQLGHRIADPACGSGGFLLGAYQYIVTELAIKAGHKGSAARRRRLCPHLGGGGPHRKGAGHSASLALRLRHRQHHGAPGADEPDDARHRRAAHRLQGHPEQELHRGGRIRHRHGQPALYRQHRQGRHQRKPDARHHQDRAAVCREHLPPAEKRRHRLRHRAARRAVRLRRGLQDPARKCWWSAATSRPSSPCPAACSSPTPGSAPPFCSSPRSGGRRTRSPSRPPNMSGSTRWQADGYSLDDKRSKQEGYGDLQDIVAKYHARNPETDTDRTAEMLLLCRAPRSRPRAMTCR